MKVLIINGSPRKDGNTSLAVREMEKIFTAENIEAETRLFSECSDIRSIVEIQSISKQRL